MAEIGVTFSHWPGLCLLLFSSDRGSFQLPASDLMDHSTVHTSVPLMMLHNSIEIILKFFGLLSLSSYRLEPVSDPWELGGTGSH